VAFATEFFGGVYFVHSCTTKTHLAASVKPKHQLFQLWSEVGPWLLTKDCKGTELVDVNDCSWKKSFITWEVFKNPVNNWIDYLSTYQLVGQISEPSTDM